jgi:hypothetical protein
VKIARLRKTIIACFFSYAGSRPQTKETKIYGYKRGNFHVGNIQGVVTRRG